MTWDTALPADWNPLPRPRSAVDRSRVAVASAAMSWVPATMNRNPNTTSARENCPTGSMELRSTQPATRAICIAMSQLR